jgi:hypothetical protein
VSVQCQWAWSIIPGKFCASLNAHHMTYRRLHTACRLGLENNRFETVQAGHPSFRPPTHPYLTHRPPIHLYLTHRPPIPPPTHPPTHPFLKITLQPFCLPGDDTTMWTDWTTAGENELLMRQLIHRIIKKHR